MSTVDLKYTQINHTVCDATKRKLFEQLNLKSESYQNINRKYPHLIQALLEDLLKVDGYSEVIVGFGTGLNLDIVRKIANKNIKRIPQRAFFDILGLYARVFCDWRHYKEEMTDE